MPFGRWSPQATTLTSRFPSLSTMAWILSLMRLDTNTVPLAEPERARVVDAARIEIDRETLRRFELVERELVGGGRERRRRDRRKLLGCFGVGSTDQRGAGRQRSL